jgi:hypothetical protein
MRTFGTACPENQGRHLIIGVEARHRRAQAIAYGHCAWRVSLIRQPMLLFIKRLSCAGSLS